MHSLTVGTVRTEVDPIEDQIFPMDSGLPYSEETRDTQDHKRNIGRNAQTDSCRGPQNLITNYSMAILVACSFSKRSYGAVRVM